MYKLLFRPFLFLFSPESIHHFTFAFLRIALAMPGLTHFVRHRYIVDSPKLERQLLGLTFKNPVGLAAGFDKDARLVDELACFGFGFIEIGTLTPIAQQGNEKPRLFRLPKDKALINRMGFNNEGVLAAVDRLRRRTATLVVGGNIGKNKATVNEKAGEDYTYCFEALYPHVDYFVVNVSSPNTPGLRELQEKEPLKNLLALVKNLSASKPVSKPVLLKIAPDLNVEQLDDIIEILKVTRTDGVIATNTTIARKNLDTSAEAVKQIGAGGLSGRPLRQISNEVISHLRKQLGPSFPIIGVGGIMTPQDAVEKIRAGADLVQVYTGFVYEGPGFVKRINRAIQSM
jgi:dihydroorotate dehydrogenase